MDKNESITEDIASDSCRNKTKRRGKKRKRKDSFSSTDESDVLPDNAQEVEKCLVACAAKNNLDDVSVKKILKKVITNDHVLALVKLREEEEELNTKKIGLQPKLTRAKVKELMKVSPNSAPWNLENLELTPIKHIPVKTRPEVKALIAQELPEDEDDEEYKPTQEDVLSDDDQGLESCSDVDSQPRTPATPKGQQDPIVVNDGVFKVPQGLVTPTRRKLDLEEEATIALRTRSKLCLSETSIEHIERSFVPPDDLPGPLENDHLWSEFLNECLNPASVTRNEEDDEADPEYSVAADPDAHEDDEEPLEDGFVDITKKELSDLVTELLNLVPEGSVEEELTNMADSVLPNTTCKQTSTRWEGKQEPLSEDDTPRPIKISDGLVFERNSITRFSIGKTEPADVPEKPVEEPPVEPVKDVAEPQTKQTMSNVVDISVQEQTYMVQPLPVAEQVPPILQKLQPEANVHRVQVTLEKEIPILTEQILILQQQLRQHIQIATTNFLQLCVNPLHWALAPTYKEYLQALMKMVDSHTSSVVDVCNLKPALELVLTWEKTVSENTPENTKMVEFVQSEAERWRRRSANNCPHVGEFHETLKRVVANSPVILYPYLLPPMPFRADSCKRFSYLRSEDELIAIGLQQFWEYLEDNPELYKRPKRNTPHRWGLTFVTELIVKHMFPWCTATVLLRHVKAARRSRDRDNPIYRFFITGEIVPVKHKIKPFNPTLTLYEQPEHEMPRLWLRYLAKTSKRFKKYLYRRPNAIGQEPRGLDVDIGLPASAPVKPPQPIDLIQKRDSLKVKIKPMLEDKIDVQIEKDNTNFYQLVETSIDSRLVPINLYHDVSNGTKVNPETNTVDCNITPITSSVETKKKTYQNKTKKIKAKEARIGPTDDPNHCRCCKILRRICKTRQSYITDYFSSMKEKRNCYCSEIKHPRISNKLRLLVSCYKTHKENLFKELKRKTELLRKENAGNKRLNNVPNTSHVDDLEFTISFYLKLNQRIGIALNKRLKRKMNTLLTSFDPDCDDPVTLAKQFDKLCDVELVEMYKEFLTFLTAEQADKLDRFRDYFTQNCVKGLVKRIEDEVSDKDTKYRLLVVLRDWFSSVEASACQMCADLLIYMDAHPALARYTFSLFPHRRPRSAVAAKRKKLDIVKNNTSLPQSTPSLPKEKEVSPNNLPDDLPEVAEKPNPAADYEADDSSRSAVEAKRKKLDIVKNNTSLPQNTPSLPKEEEVLPNDLQNDPPEVAEQPNPAADYEADHSSPGDENCDAESVTEQQALNTNIKSENTGVSEINGSGWIVDTQLTVSKAEAEEYCQSSDEMSMMIISEEEIIKSEPLEWKREEDKLILEVLKQHLLLEDLNEKTILEILEEKDVVQMIYESLNNKSVEDIKTRVLYLLKILLLGVSQ